MLRRVAFGTFFILASIAGAPAQERQAPASQAEINLSFAPIVKRVAPAVVNVYASRHVQQRAVSPFFNDPFFRRFFADSQGQERVQRSLGSGVIVDPSGLVVTNLHVIANADEVRAVTADKREWSCDILLKDERSDLAVLRLKGDGTTFAFLPFSDSDAAEVGDLVLAIGNPFGVGQTVTTGIVSALARTGIGDGSRYFIQTDAAINPGNSGGALVDMAGRLVGINTAIASPSGASSGVGFAIPSNLVRVVANSARKGDAMHRPWVGVRLQSVNAEIAAGLGLERPLGALVTEVTAASPGAKAGLKVGDLITAIDGNEIEDPVAFDYRVATRGVGETAEFTVVREGKRYAARVRLDPAPETVPRDERLITGSSPFAGARIANLSPAVAEELSLKGGGSDGVVITDVEDGSIAARVNFQRGDIVREVNGVKVDSTRRLAELSGANARTWRLEIERDGRRLRSVIGG